MKEFNDIRSWASSRGLYDQGDVKTQLVKLCEELGELSQAILKKNEEEFIDAIGDCVVVLTNLAYLSNDYFSIGREQFYYEDVAGDGGGSMQMTNEEWIDIEYCIQCAFDAIKDRSGKMDNGTFKKDR